MSLICLTGHFPRRNKKYFLILYSILLGMKIPSVSFIVITHRKHDQKKKKK